MARSHHMRIPIYTKQWKMFSMKNNLQYFSLHIFKQWRIALARQTLMNVMHLHQKLVFLWLFLKQSYRAPASATALIDFLTARYCPLPSSADYTQLAEKFNYTSTHSAIQNTGYSSLFTERQVCLFKTKSEQMRD